MSSMSETVNGLNLDFVEALYHDYQRDPSSVESEWRAYFEWLDSGERRDGKRPPVTSRERASSGDAVRAACARMRLRLDHQRARPFAQRKAFAVEIKRATRTCRIVASGRQHAHR